MVVKGPQQLETPPIAPSRRDVREALIELWAQVLERDLSADLKAEAEARGERARLRAIHNAPLRGIDGDSDVAEGSSPERGRPCRSR
jgi:hypothetical protein